MPLPGKRLLCLSLALLLCCLSRQVLAQDVWTNARSATGKVSKAVGRQGAKLKKFRRHLEQWGLDEHYNHGISICARLNSNGWSGLLCYQQRIDRRKSHFFQLSFSELVHEKQVKQQRSNTLHPELGAATPFVFGKINNVYTASIGYGREFLLLPGVLEGNLSVSLRMQAGFSLALLKPYYLKLIYTDTAGGAAHVQEEKYGDGNSDRFLNSSAVLGASKWKKGLNELTFAPGAYADIALAIEPSKNKTFIRTVCLGGAVSIYSKKLSIMADQDAFPWQACLYAGLSLGKRWK